MTIVHSRKKIRSALALVLSGALLGWLLFVASIISDIAATSGKTNEELWGSDAEAIVYPSKYLIFAAIAVFAIASLIAKTIILKVRTSQEDVTRLAKPAQEFASVAIIVSLALAVFAVIVVFTDSFMGYSGDQGTLARIFDAYLPIILYTVLVIIVLLTGFVFSRNPKSKQDGEVTPIELSSDPDPRLKESQKGIGISFSVPIIAVAVALIFGLIVYDLTKTSLEAWIWVAIQTIVSAGIIVGTIYAARSLKAQETAGKPRAGVAVGAQNLNFVLSVLFVTVVTLMSLSYGTSATQQLRVQHDVSISVYSDNSYDFKDNAETLDIEGASVYASGSGLQSGSLATITVEPVGSSVADTKVDSQGYLNLDASFPNDLPTGDVTFKLTTFNSEGSAIMLELAATINSDGTASFQEGTNSFSASEGVKLGKITMHWAFKNFLPALLLLLIALTTIYVTLTSRNKD